MIKAIYELKRQGLLLAKLNPTTTDAVGDALAHAYNARMCPIFHSRHEPHSGINDPFDDAYDIPRELVAEVVNFCDERWLAKQAVTFSDLEAKYGRERRIDLIEIVRYAALSGKFDGAFYRMLLSRCPAEAHGCTGPLRLGELDLRS